MIKRHSLFILLNLVIITNVLIILFSTLIKIPSSFQYFTVLSNIFMAIVAAVAIITFLKHSSSQIVDNLYLVATTSLVLVFLVVVLFLSPQYENPSFLFTEYNFFLHLLNPFLAAISLLLIKDAKFNRKTRFFTLIPPFLYAIIYFIFVIVKKEWSDFYNFTLGGKTWVSFITLLIILCVTYATSAILVFAYKKLSSQ